MHDVAVGIVAACVRLARAGRRAAGATCTMPSSVPSAVAGAGSDSSGVGLRRAGRRRGRAAGCGVGVVARRWLGGAAQAPGLRGDGVVRRRVGGSLVGIRLARLLRSQCDRRSGQQGEYKPVRESRPDEDRPFHPDLLSPSTPRRPKIAWANSWEQSTPVMVKTRRRREKFRFRRDAGTGEQPARVKRNVQSSCAWSASREWVPRTPRIKEVTVEACLAAASRFFVWLAFACDRGHNARGAPDLLESERDRAVLLHAFFLAGRRVSIFAHAGAFEHAFKAPPEKPLPWIAVPN